MNEDVETLAWQVGRVAWQENCPHIDQDPNAACNRCVAEMVVTLLDQARADAAEKALAPVLALADKWDEQLRDDLNLPGDEWHHWHSTQLRHAVASHQEDGA